MKQKELKTLEEEIKYNPITQSYDFGWIMIIGLFILGGILMIYTTIEIIRVDNFCSDLPNIHCQREACNYKYYSNNINRESLEGCMLLERVYNLSATN